MNARIQLAVALLFGLAAGIGARALGYTDILVNIATVVTVMLMLWGGFWWMGTKRKGE